MAISKERMDRFTSKDTDFVIIKPAPKKPTGKQTGDVKPKPKKPAKGK